VKNELLIIFPVINGGDKPLDIVECPKCKGVTFIDVRHTLHRTKTGVSAGIKAKVCLTCVINGEIVMMR